MLYTFKVLHNHKCFYFQQAQFVIILLHILMRHLVVGILLDQEKCTNILFFPSRNRTELKTTIVNIKCIEKKKL